MSARDLVALIHLAGFATGIALYGMLALMTRRSARHDQTVATGGGIALLAALLGLIWNAGALVVYGWQDFNLGQLSPWVTVLSYSALGFLPAVVVDAATRSPEPRSKPSALAICAYALSAAATVLQVVSVAQAGVVSTTSLLTLTIGYITIVVLVAIKSVGRTGSQRALTAVALAAFAVSAFHLSRHSTANDTSWMVELIGHHASLPLVLVILYQDYRFAFADIFLKRALAILLLVAIVVSAYALLFAPMLSADAAQLPIRLPAMLLTAWIATALTYPLLRRGVDSFVDRVVLGRTDYRRIRASLVAELSVADSVENALARGCECARVALGAHDVTWSVDDAKARHDGLLVSSDGSGATISIPTAERPAYVITVSHLAAGRRLLSDDASLLDAAALLIARRIDELRVADERLHRDLREHEMHRLATVAELETLRAQLNPHFLFNALSTVGYLIQEAPERAVATLYQLTSLLRAVLRRNTDDFVSLDQEMQIVDSYLAIESARFEERLTVIRDVPHELLSAAIPPLILQPIVENAIKHGVSRLREGGVVRITALRSIDATRTERLRLVVSDTGPGVTEQDLETRRKVGIGLSNIARRLEHYYAADGRLDVSSTLGAGTIATIEIPLSLKRPARSDSASPGGRGRTRRVAS